MTWYIRIGTATCDGSRAALGIAPRVASPPAAPGRRGLVRGRVVPAVATSTTAATPPARTSNATARRRWIRLRRRRARASRRAASSSKSITDARAYATTSPGRNAGRRQERNAWQRPARAATTSPTPASGDQDWSARREPQPSSSMRLIRTAPARSTAASKLRAWADQLAPPARLARSTSAAPLVRFGGVWWQRDEIAGADDQPGQGERDGS
jgi:hypothetical protein